MFQQDI